MLRTGPDGLPAGPGRRRLGGAGSGCSAGAPECNAAPAAEAAL